MLLLVKQAHLRRQVCDLGVAADVQDGEVGQLVDVGGDGLDPVPAHVEHAQRGKDDGRFARLAILSTDSHVVVNLIHLLGRSSNM